MKGHSRVFVGGWLPVSWTLDRLRDIRSSVQLLLWRPRERGLQDLQLDFFTFQRGRCLNDGGASPSLTCPLGDETVRWAKPASTSTASFSSRRSSSSRETGLVGGRLVAPSSTSMAVSSPGDEPETGAAALSEGASSTPESGGITTSAPWSSGLTSREHPVQACPPEGRTPHGRCVP